MKRTLFSISNCAAFATAVALLTFTGAAQAQIFCPAAVPGQTGIALQNGTCTNGTTGAYSNATLASQALSDLSQSTTQETTRTATNAIADRRQTEADRCPDGTERIGGVCRRPAAVEAAPAAAPVQPVSAEPARRAARRVQRERRGAPVVRRAAPVRAPVYKALPVPVIDEGIRVAAWTRVFGDYERRTGNGASSINCCTNAVPPAGIPIPLTLSAESRASTVGFLGGLDFTSRNLLSQGDGVIAGFLAGYAETDFRLTTNSISAVPANVGNGSSTLTARLSGPSVGVFATYFNGGFSIDNTFKVDFLTLNENFTDNLAFTANAPGPGVPGGGLAPAFATFTGFGSTRLTNYSSFGNINYRFRLSDQYWIEPTVGYNYTATEYDANSALLGLSDGHLLRLQGGARFGVESMWDRMRVTTTLTGLAYDDVTVSGGIVQNAAFGTTSSLLLAQEGKIRGQGILAFNFDFGGGVSSFVLGEVRGGEGLFGAGGKAGVRYQW